MASAEELQQLLTRQRQAEADAAARAAEDAEARARREAAEEEARRAAERDAERAAEAAQVERLHREREELEQALQARSPAISLLSSF